MIARCDGSKHQQYANASQHACCHRLGAIESRNCHIATLLFIEYSVALQGQFMNGRISTGCSKRDQDNNSEK